MSTTITKNQANAIQVEILDLQRRADADRRRARRYRAMLEWLLENASGPVFVEMEDGSKRRIFNAMDLEELMEDQNLL